MTNRSKPKVHEACERPRIWGRKTVFLKFIAKTKTKQNGCETIADTAEHSMHRITPFYWEDAGLQKPGAKLKLWSDREPGALAGYAPKLKCPSPYSDSVDGESHVCVTLLAVNSRPVSPSKAAPVDISRASIRRGEGCELRRRCRC